MTAAILNDKLQMTTKKTFAQPAKHTNYVKNAAMSACVWLQLYD